jgi:predicted transcriptional regulator
MRSRPAISRPTDSELMILSVLWREGACTVRQVMELLDPPKGYTTILKLLQIMLEKQMVLRDESNRTHVYESRFSKEQVQGHLVTDLLNRAFGGSAANLVFSLLGEKRTSEQEITEIRRLIDKMEGDE